MKNQETTAKLIWGVLFLGAFVRVQAAIIPAHSPSFADVTAAVSSAANGDTVLVPAGQATWTSTLAYSKDITLQGAGTNSTFIVDEVSPRAPVIAVAANTSGESRITGFTFMGGVTNTANPYDGAVYVGGNCWECRVDHCNFTNLYNDQLFFDGWNYGVVDHCSFIANFKIAITVSMPAYGGHLYGDGSWSDNEMLGSTNAIVVEDCYIYDEATGGPAANALDVWAGGRAVFRHNYCLNTAPTTHGTETSGRSRGFRTEEVYNNTIVGTDPNCNSTGCFRGGTGLIYSNNYVGPYFCGGLTQLTDYRAADAFGAWWVANGVCSWDSNSPTLFGSGVCTSAGSQTMTDVGAAWTPGQWVNYTLYDTNTGYGSFITANTATTISFADTGNGASLVFSPGDHYQFRQTFILLDQVGRGKGDLLSGYPPTNSVLGGTNWPRQALEPVYAWSNVINGTLTGLACSQPTIHVNRDFYNDTPAPGYVPLVYPHPLVQYTPEFTLTVNGGTGSGIYLTNSVVSISTNAPGFISWSGMTNYLANPAAASTTVNLATNVMVTANYASIPTYALTVNGGSGGGNYFTNSLISISTNAPGFISWSGMTNYLANPAAAGTTVNLATNVTVTANYASVPTYALTVNGGTGGGSYAAGTTVAITAATVSGQTFANWIGATNYLANVVAATTTLTMPSSAVTISATYVAAQGQTQSSGSPASVTNGLVAQWTLAGDVNDHVGTNNGVGSGSPAYVAGPTGTTNSAISLNGASQHIQTTTMGNFGSNCSSGFTLTAWVQSSYTSSYEAIFGSQGTSGMAVSLYINYNWSGGVGAGLIEGLVRDSANSAHVCDVSFNSGITDGNWHFIVWVDNPAANSGTIYVDGVALNTVMQGSAASTTTVLPNPMGLGVRTGLNDGLFNGALADCRIYQRTLSASEVSNLYSSGAAGGFVTVHPVVAPPSNLQTHPPGTN